MKKYFSFIIAFIFLFILVGCTLPEVSVIDFSVSRVKTTTIRVWMDDTDGVFMNELIPAFNEQYPSIEVKFQHMATVDSREKLKTLGPSGNGADVFQFPHDHMSQAILEDLVLPLPESTMTRLQERISDIALDIATAYYDPATKSFDKVEGAAEQLFAVPISNESVFLFCNNDIIDPAEVPTSWGAFLDKAKTWEAAHPGKEFLVTSSHWADGYFVQSIFSSFEWRPFGPSGDDANNLGFAGTDGTANAKLAAAIGWLTNDLKPVVTGNGSHNSVGGAKFEAGEAALVLSGPWQTNTYKDLGINYSALKMPNFSDVDGANGTESTFAGAQMVAVYKYSQNQDAAIKFVEFLASDEGARILYETSGDCPALKPELIEQIAGLKDDPVLAVMLEQLETSIPMPTIPEVTHYWAPIETAVKNVWNNAADINAELVEAQKSYEAKRALSGR